MSEWKPIEEMPEGNDSDGPFFDVTWLGAKHDYLPVPQRCMNCYKQNGTVKMIHDYPAIWTIFRPQPTHFLAIPTPPEE